MVQAGLYVAGSDPLVDAAIAAWPALDAFVGAPAAAQRDGSFSQLGTILDAVDPDRRGTRGAKAAFTS
jgi:flagellum-specific ATP synthase